MGDVVGGAFNSAYVKYAPGYISRTLTQKLRDGAKRYMKQGRKEVAITGFDPDGHWQGPKTGATPETYTNFDLPFVAKGRLKDLAEVYAKKLPRHAYEVRVQDGVVTPLKYRKDFRKGKDGSWSKIGPKASRQRTPKQRLHTQYTQHFMKKEGLTFGQASKAASVAAQAVIEHGAQAAEAVAEGLRSVGR